VVSPVLCASIPGMQDWAYLCSGGRRNTMATRIFTEVRDDIDGSEANQTIRF
jgi:hypothetical protein